MQNIKILFSLISFIVVYHSALSAYPIPNIPDEASLDSVSIGDSIEITEQLREIGEKNVFKKALTLTKIAWTPLRPIANLPYGSKIIEGQTVYGIPYSSCGQVDKYVGDDVSIKTFMTAVNNPYSLLYTEDLYHNKSGYGFNYIKRKNCSLYFGITCSMFVKICLGLKIQHATASMPRMARKGFYTRPEKSSQTLQVGDVLSKTLKPGHVRIIAGLTKDSIGNTTKIYCAESVEMQPKFNVWTPEQFDNACMLYDLYRPTNLEMNSYELDNDFFNFEESAKIDYTNNYTIGIQKTDYKYNNDICTFAGDYATFRHNQIIFINYNLKEIGNWNELELHNDTTILGCYSINKEEHGFDLTPMNLPYGKYKARLVNGNKRSEFTYFEILDTDAVLTMGDGFKCRIDFDTQFGTPLYIQFVNNTGGSLGTYELNDEEIQNGFVELNAAMVINNILLKNNIYWKVKYRGDYGTATSEPMLSDINKL